MSSLFYLFVLVAYLILVKKPIKDGRYLDRCAFSWRNRHQDNIYPQGTVRGPPYACCLDF